METVQNFFLFCSGVDHAILEKCPSDKNKYVGIGATVFFTGVLAFFSSGYALYTVFESYWAAVAFGLIWGLMIFNLDRYIVMSMKSYGKWWRDWFVALPRLALAVLLALVISKPLEMKIFEKEIQAELVQMEQEVYKDQEDKVKKRYQGQVASLNAEITALKTEVEQKTASGMPWHSKPCRKPMEPEAPGRKPGPDLSGKESRCRQGPGRAGSAAGRKYADDPRKRGCNP